MKYNSTQLLGLEAGGKGVAGHAGLWQLGRFADRLGVPRLWSAAFEPPGRGGRRHDRGTMLVQAAVMLAGGGEACTDIEYLRVQPALFGDAPSDSTLYRMFHSIGEGTARRLSEGLAQVRARLWNQLTAGADEEGAAVVLDIDSSFHEIHSENKQHAAPTYKGGYGFHPIYCFLDATGECLAALLRPGNAGANKVDDHITVLEQALLFCLRPPPLQECGSGSIQPGGRPWRGNAAAAKSGSASSPAAAAASKPPSTNSTATIWPGSPPSPRSPEAKPAPKSPKPPTSSTHRHGRPEPG